MERSSTVLTNLTRAVIVLAIGVLIWRAATLPVSASEAAAWDRVVRPPAATVLVTPGDGSTFLYGLVAKRTVGLFRLSAFSLRLPGILGFLLLCYALDRLARGRPSIVVVLVAACWWGGFNLAGGAGLAIGLSALALAHPRWAGLWIGLALAAAPQIPAVPLLIAAILLFRTGFWTGMERVVIPAIAIGFVLLIVPLSHAGPPSPEPTGAAATDVAVRDAVAVLRAEAGQGSARISVSPSVTALFDFYRARYRQREWLVDPVAPQYFLWLTSDPPPSTASRRELFHRDGVVLAQ